MLALLCGASALVVTLTREVEGPSAGGRAAAEGLAPGGVSTGFAPNAQLAKRVASIEERVRALANRVDELTLASGEPAGGRAAVDPNFVTRAELDSLLAEFEAGLEGDAGRAARKPPSPLFIDRVRDAMREIRVDEARHRAAETVQRRSAALEKGLAKVAQELGLTVSQQARLREAIVGMYARQAEYAVLWESGEVASKQDFGPILEADGAAFLEELRGILTPGQLDAYLALQGDLFPGAGPGGK